MAKLISGTNSFCYRITVEAGAVAAVHGALAAGSLSTTQPITRPTLNASQYA